MPYQYYHKTFSRCKKEQFPLLIFFECSCNTQFESFFFLQLENLSQFISKHKISKRSFLNVISPNVEAISWFFGSILLIFTFSFDKTQLIVSYLYHIGWIKFLQSLQDWCEQFIRSMSERMMPPSVLNISPKKNEVCSQWRSVEITWINRQKFLKVFTDITLI